jgi:molybdopterin synthase catalytic subunit
MNHQVIRAVVVDEPLSIAAHADLVAHEAAGAVVTFDGVVRNHDGGKTVLSLDYHGHPSANDVISTITEKLVADREGVRAVAVSHRVGSLKIGDTALAVAVAAEHRKQAFTACADLVDEVKRRLPIWKHQKFGDGTEEWVNCP